jgi:uncharacterized iron-regulated protein
MEMFDRSYQTVLDLWAEGSLDEETFVPDPASTQVYRQMYETFYRDLYPRLAPINHDIEAVWKLLP